MADRALPDRRDPSRRRDGNWRDLALCQGMDTNTFFPISSKGPFLSDVAEAKRVCALCPAQADCLTWALEHRVDHGIWGGLTETERQALIVRRRRHHRREASSRTP